jgi:uncharacterized protein YbjT (DUF2867 family)
MRIAVIGTPVPIGSKLVERLRGEGHEVLGESVEGVQVAVGAESAAGVGHHVLLSLPGADPLAERAVRTGAVPYTIVRVAHVFELLGGVADSNTHGDAVRLPPALVQPVAAEDVAGTLADVAVGAPLEDTVELAGPQVFRLDELVRRLLAASDDPRTVTTDAGPDEPVLLPGADARIGSTTFEDWLRR